MEPSSRLEVSTCYFARILTTWVSASTSVFRAHPCRCLHSITMFCFAHRDRRPSQTFAHQSFVSNRLLVWLIITGCASSRDVRQLCASIRPPPTTGSDKIWPGLACIFGRILPDFQLLSDFARFCQILSDIARFLAFVR